MPRFGQRCSGEGGWEVGGFLERWFMEGPVSTAYCGRQRLAPMLVQMLSVSVPSYSKLSCLSGL